MSLTEFIVPTYLQMLKRLAAWLDKAAQTRASGSEADTLMSLRLAPDMYPLASQIRFVSFMAQETVYRLRGEPVPEALLEVRSAGWSAGEHPGTFQDARALIDQAVSLLSGLEVGALDGGTDMPIALELPNGMIFDMSGSQYARDWVLPQFYFHLVTAYAILRNHGVELGKADYVQYMLAYLRPGTMPQS